MNKLQFASKMLLIEAKAAEVRAYSLLMDDPKTIKALQSLHEQIGHLMCEVLSPDETRLYLAK